MGGGGGGPAPEVPFNMAELAPLMPSVFNGPYNAQGALQNEEMLAKKYPWITPPAGQFEGAQPGQFAGGQGAGGNVSGQFGFPGSGVPVPPNPNPPIPPTVPQGGGQFNQVGMAGNQVNSMQPNTLQQILAVLGSQGSSGQ